MFFNDLVEGLQSRISIFADHKKLCMVIITEDDNITDRFREACGLGGETVDEV